jgi:hypothetical protein
MDITKPVRTDQIGTAVGRNRADGEEIVETREEVSATARAPEPTRSIRLQGGRDMMLDTYWEQAASAVEERDCSARLVAS